MRRPSTRSRPTRAKRRPRPARDDEDEPSSKTTVWFWAVLVERARQFLEELHGDDWTRVSTADDVRRATILARREVLADSDTKSPPCFLREHFADVTEETLRTVRQYLTEYGFNSHVAGRIAPSDVAFRLATMPTLDWTRQRDHGRRAWWTQLHRLFGKIYILDIGCGTKSWSRWLTDYVDEKSRHRFQVVTIDWDASMEPDIVADITKWRTWLHVELEKRGYGAVRFHIVHFAAECTEYSPLKNGRERDFAYANFLAESGMNLILELRPVVWFIECAGTGAQALQHQPIMNDAHMKQRHVDVTLCNFGSDFQKHSSWWSSIPKHVQSYYGIPNAPCCAANGHKCAWSILVGHHPRHVGGGHARRFAGRVQTPSVGREESMAYPSLLCNQLMCSALHAMLTYEEAASSTSERRIVAPLF